MLGVRIFVSSPGDVEEERRRARSVIARLDLECAHRGSVRGIFWEDQPLHALKTPQASIPPAADCDIFVCILWSRLGTPLPPSMQRRGDNTRYESGTEFELEQAVASRRDPPPEILAYKKTAPCEVPIDSIARDELLELYDQRERLDRFIEKWFEGGREGDPGSLRRFRDADEFEEMLETHLRALIDNLLRHDPVSEDQPLAPPSWSEAPYRGLQVFELRHAPIFFGRNQAIHRVIDALRKQTERGCAFVMILGMSGIGKSSLVQAGVLPSLMNRADARGERRGWRYAVLKLSPSTSEPTQQLAEALMEQTALPELLELGTRSDFSDALRDRPSRAVKLIEGAVMRAAGGPEQPPDPSRRLVLIVDQLEELFEVTRDAEAERDAFVNALGDLARSGLVSVLATLRNDYYSQVAAVPALVELKSGHGLYDLTPPNRAEMQDMILMPARAAGLRFARNPETGELLSDILLNDAASEPASLPLLEFTLAALYKRRQGRLLTFEAYEELGRFGGAVASLAEERFARLDPDAQEAFPRVLRRLVRVRPDDREVFLRSRAPYRELTADSSNRSFIEAFVRERLLSVDDSNRERAQLSVVHDALFRHWPRLAAWLDENKELLACRERIGITASEWVRAGRPVDRLLPPGGAVDEACAVREAFGEELSADVSEFIDGSRRRARRARILRATAAAAIATFALVACAAAWMAIGSHQRQTRAQLRVLEELGRQALLDREPDRALAYLSEAYGLAPNRWSLRFLVRRATAMLPLPPVVRHREDVYHASFDPGGRRVLTASADGLARVWDPVTGSLLAELKGHRDRIVHATFSPDGSRVLTASFDRTARLWDADTGQPLQQLSGHRDSVLVARFDLHGDRILTGSSDGTARLWDADSGALMRSLRGHEGAVEAAALGPGGSLVVTASLDGSAKIWEAASGRVRASLDAHPLGVNDLEFSPDGSWVVLAGEDGTATLWDPRDGRLLATLQRHDRGIRDVAVSPDGVRLATASDDGTIALWAAPSGERLLELRGHAGGVRSVRFSPDGEQLVSGGDDRVARIWNVADGTLVTGLRGHSDIILSAAFDPEGARVVTASLDDSARIWDARSEEWLAAFDEPNEVVSASFAPHGSMVLSASSDGVIRLWSVEKRALVRELLGHEQPITHAAFSPDGALFVTSSWDTTARVWDASGGLVAVLEGHSRRVRRASFDPRGARIVTAGSDDTAGIWDARSGRRLFELSGHRGDVRAASFSPDGGTVVTASEDGTARIYDAGTGAELAILKGHEGAVVAASFDPSGRQVATASSDATARLWSVPEGDLRVVLKGHQEPLSSVGFDPEGRFVVTASDDGTARIWSARTGVVHNKLIGHSKAVLSAAFDPRGARVVTAGSDGTAIVWETQTGEILLEIPAHLDAVKEARFNADGSRLLTAGADGSIKIWDVGFETRSPSEIHAFADCHVPWRVHEDVHLVPSPRDPGGCSGP